MFCQTFMVAVSLTVKGYINLTERKFRQANYFYSKKTLKLILAHLNKLNVNSVSHKFDFVAEQIRGKAGR